MGFADPRLSESKITFSSDESQTGGSGSVTHYQTGEFHDLFVRRAGGETQIVVIEPF
jgi:hypothetical protein